MEYYIFLAVLEVLTINGMVTVFVKSLKKLWNYSYYVENIFFSYMHYLKYFFQLKLKD